jgi:hypothetical protein
LAECRHESLEPVGEQKTEDGVNSYYRCAACGTLLVVLPDRRVVAIPGVQQGTPPQEGANTS